MPFALSNFNFNFVLASFIQQAYSQCDQCATLNAAIAALTVPLALAPSNPTINCLQGLIQANGQPLPTSIVCYNYNILDETAAMQCITQTVNVPAGTTLQGALGIFFSTVYGIDYATAILPFSLICPFCP